MCTDPVFFGKTNSGPWSVQTTWHLPGHPIDSDMINAFPQGLLIALVDELTISSRSGQVPAFDLFSCFLLGEGYELWPPPKTSNELWITLRCSELRRDVTITSSVQQELVSRSSFGSRHFGDRHLSFSSGPSGIVSFVCALQLKRCK